MRELTFQNRIDRSAKVFKVLRWTSAFGAPCAGSCERVGVIAVTRLCAAAVFSSLSKYPSRLFCADRTSVFSIIFHDYISTERRDGVGLSSPACRNTPAGCSARGLSVSHFVLQIHSLFTFRNSIRSYCSLLVIVNGLRLFCSSSFCVTFRLHLISDCRGARPFEQYPSRLFCAGRTSVFSIRFHNPFQQKGGMDPSSPARRSTPAASTAHAVSLSRFVV